MSGSESDSYLSADEENSSPAKLKADNTKRNTEKAKSNKTPKRTAVETQRVAQQSADDSNKAENMESKEVDEGWDNDDWGNAADDGDGDGWDDFGDWNDDGTKPSAPSSATGSKAKQDTERSALNTRKQDQIISSYDIFPVLNELQNEKSGKHFAAQTPILETESKQIETNKPVDSSSWGWKPWGGVVSFISNATEGVTSLTSHVGHGICSVLENSIGVPDPAEMARIQLENEKKAKESGEAEGDVETEKSERTTTKSECKDDFRSSVGNILTGVTQIGNKVITGGLDTLEGIGKKTMTILQENDPLLLNKRKFLGLDGDKPVLSQILREAKEKSDEAEKNLKQMQKNAYKKQLHFETLFDHYHGLVHLEALEMLSKQSSIKLQSLIEPLSGKALAELEETLNEVKELCDLGDIDNEENDGLDQADELKVKLAAATEDLGVDTDFTDLLKCWTENVDTLKNMENAEPQEIYDKALRCLAETTALIVTKMHKIAELILIKDHHSTANEADSLVQLTTVFCCHLHGVANLFGTKLNSYDTTEETSSLITSIFLEESNSSSYVKSAFQLFIPILQIGAA